MLYTLSGLQGNTADERVEGFTLVDRGGEVSLIDLQEYLKELLPRVAKRRVGGRDIERPDDLLGHSHGKRKISHLQTQPHQRQGRPRIGGLSGDLLPQHLLGPVKRHVGGQGVAAGEDQLGIRRQRIPGHGKPKMMLHIAGGAIDDEEPFRRRHDQCSLGQLDPAVDLQPLRLVGHPLLARGVGRRKPPEGPVELIQPKRSYLAADRVNEIALCKQVLWRIPGVATRGADRNNLITTHPVKNEHMLVIGAKGDHAPRCDHGGTDLPRAPLLR